jgi:hypothetical protein
MVNEAMTALRTLTQVGNQPFSGNVSLEVLVQPHGERCTLRRRREGVISLFRPTSLVLKPRERRPRALRNLKKVKRTNDLLVGPAVVRSANHPAQPGPSVVVAEETEPFEALVQARHAKT